MDTPQENPYNFSRPVKTLKKLGGRDMEIENITASLRGKQMSLALIGKRGIGKTSLLAATHEICLTLDFIPLTIKLDSNLVEHEYTFLIELYTGLMSLLKEKAFISKNEYDTFVTIVDDQNLDSSFFLKFPKSYINFLKTKSPTATRQYIYNDLKTLQERTGKQIVILLDECNSLIKNKGLLEFLRNFLQTVDGYTLVLAGTEEFLENLNEVFEPVVREIKKIDINGFKDIEQTINFIHKCLDENDQKKLSYDVDLFEDLHKISEGNPYELKVLCHFLWEDFFKTKSLEEVKEIKFKLSPQIFQKVADQMSTANPEHQKFISDATDLQHAELLAVIRLVNHERLTIREKSVLSKIFEDNYSTDTVDSYEKDLRRSAMSLKKYLDIDENDKVIFKGEGFEKTYIKYLAQSRLKDEDAYWINSSFPYAIYSKLFKLLRKPLHEGKIKGSAYYSNLTRAPEDHRFFESKFSKKYTYFSSDKTKLSDSYRENHDLNSFVKAYLQFNGKPVYRCFTITLKQLVTTYYGHIIFEDVIEEKNFSDLLSKYDEHFKAIDMTVKQEIVELPTLEREKIFDKLKAIKNDKESYETLLNTITTVAINFTTDHELFELSEYTFENLRLVNGASFDLNNNIGFINIKLSPEKALQEITNNLKYLNKKEKGDFFIHYYNLASLYTYLKRYPDAKSALKETDRLKNLGKEKNSRTHFIYTFYIGMAEDEIHIEEFSDNNFRVAPLLLEIYINEKNLDLNIKKTEQELLLEYKNFSKDITYLKGLCGFYKKINDEEKLEKYTQILKSVQLENEQNNL